ncbi:MAG: hypothetical protein GHCLOJNM_00736 [bacterium]|nr:hypothetical protein [bacterium]
MSKRKNPQISQMDADKNKKQKNHLRKSAPSADSDSSTPPSGELLIYESQDGRIKLDVRLERESIWLTQPLMARLFQTTQQNISQHILNIYEEGELAPEATHKKFLSVRQEGSRRVQRELDYYNLDMIISVGYRVKSLIATRFRIWATERLREYRPDFLIRLTNGVMLVLETKGQETEQDKVKRRYLDEWTQAVNAHGGFGQWHAAVVQDPGEIRDALMAHETRESKG